MSKGMIYIPAGDLASDASLEEIIKRLRAVDISAPTATAEADALLGLAKPAAPTIRQAFKIYCDTIWNGVWRWRILGLPPRSADEDRFR